MFCQIDQLLLSFARNTEAKRSQTEIIDLTKKNIDWQRFISKANFLGLVPKCYLQIKKFNIAVPREIINSLHTIYDSNLAHNMRLYAKLLEIIESFFRAKIDIIPIKGPILSHTLYGRIGNRKYSDLDILIRKQDFPRAKKVLSDIGYLPVKLPYSEEFIMQFLRHRPFLKSPQSSLNPMIEVHWNFYTLKKQEFNMDAVWKTAVTRKIDAISFLSLSPEFILLHLAVTLRLHGYLILRHYLDIDALLTKYKEDIDWEKITRLAIINRQKTALFFALHFTKELIKTDIPSCILKKTKPNWLQYKLVSRFTNPLKIMKIKNSMFHSDLVNLLTFDRIFDAVRVLFRLLFTRSQDMTERYDRSSFSSKSRSSPLLRPFSLIRTVIKNIFQLLKS